MTPFTYVKKVHQL